MLRRALALLCAIGLFYALFVYGASDINSRLIREDKEALPILGKQRPLLLSADALVEKAEQLKVDNPEKAEQLVLTALQQDPSSGRAASFLLYLYLEQGEKEKARGIVEIAESLWPSHTYTQSRIADYWLNQGQDEKVIQKWNILLARNGALRKVLFPHLEKVILDEKVAGLLQPYADNPPAWWDSFFAHLSSRIPLQRLREIYQVRSMSSVEISKVERRYYVSRLIKEQRWDEAHGIWFLGLEPTQSRYMGLVFDGGFESGVYNQGFGWQFSRSKNPKIKLDVTYGIKGRRALHIVLRKKEKGISFRHVSQRLLLEPNKYTLSFRYRADALKAEKGLSWRIRCINEAKQLLTESKSILGSSAWSASSINFEVPQGCRAQELRLEATSRFWHQQKFSGGVWFDNVQISRRQGK